MIKSFFRDNKIHKSIVPYFDYIFLLRPTLYFAIWVMVVLGMATAKMTIISYPLWINKLDYSTFFIFFGITLISSSTFIINQIKDKVSDTENNKLFLIDDYIKKESAQTINHIIAIIGILILLLTNIYLAPFGIIIYLLWGIIYNNPPFEWKKRPFLGLLTNASAGIVLFLLGWFHIKGFNDFDIIELLILMIPYILCFTSVSLMANIPDLKGDSYEKMETFPVKFGSLATSILSLFFVILAFLISYNNSDPIGSTASLCSIPFFIFATFRNLEKDILRSIRYPIFLLNFFASVVYPWLLFLGIIIYYFSKYYYWHRFDLHYPTFLVEND